MEQPLARCMAGGGIDLDAIDPWAYGDVEDLGGQVRLHDTGSLPHRRCVGREYWTAAPYPVRANALTRGL
jgi:hypothetical protein